MVKYEITKTKTGYQWKLWTKNNKVFVTGNIYKTRKSCVRAIYTLHEIVDCLNNYADQCGLTACIETKKESPPKSRNRKKQNI